MMYCPKCGAENKDAKLICENCGFSLVKAPKPQPEKTRNESLSKELVSINVLPVSKPKRLKKRCFRDNIIAYGLWGAAILVLVFSMIGAISVFYGGNAIAGIRTFSGNTLEEAFFHRLQPVYNGFGFFLLAAGIFFSGVLAFLGHCLHKKDKTKIVEKKEPSEPTEEPRTELIPQ